VWINLHTGSSPVLGIKTVFLLSSPTRKQLNPKEIAAKRAVAYVQDGMVVGLGTGSTTAFAIAALGERLQTESLNVTCVATSIASTQLALSYNIPLIDWNNNLRFDVTIDGADEVDPQFRLIKGGGGALVREKLVAAATAQEIIVVDSGKVKSTLGMFPLPIAVIPFAWQSTQERLQGLLNVHVIPRCATTGELFVSDDGLYVLDAAIGASISSPELLEQQIKGVLGVAEVGLFIGLCQRLIVGYADGHVEETTAPSLQG
jgi:ribose 5-phosphate isomerase A